MLEAIRSRYAEAWKRDRGKRIYDEAVRQALTVVQEAADRICGKRLKVALPSMVESLERHGHLYLDPDVRERLFSANAFTMDRLLRPVKEQAGSRRRVKRRRKMGSRVPVRTFTDWTEPSPGVSRSTSWRITVVSPVQETVPEFLCIGIGSEWQIVDRDREQHGTQKVAILTGSDDPKRRIRTPN